MNKLILISTLLSILFSCQKKNTPETRQRIRSANVAKEIGHEQRQIQKADAMVFLDSLEAQNPTLYGDVYEIIKQNVIENAQ